MSIWKRKYYFIIGIYFIISPILSFSFYPQSTDNVVTHLTEDKYSETLIFKSDSVSPDTLFFEKEHEKYILKKSRQLLPEIEQLMIEAGLVNIRDYDSTIGVHLIYSTPNNFMHRNLYGELKEAYLQIPVAQQLARAQKYLKDTLPEYSLIIYDAARPLSIQKLMWDSIPVPKDKRWKYLSNPMYGSLHNYGAAVDVSIIDKNGIPLDMGTTVDFFGTLAYPVMEQTYFASGKLSNTQISNRKLLRAIMEKAAFSGITTEWWHFNACRYLEAKNYYKTLKNHTLKQNNKQFYHDNVSDIFFQIQIKLSSKALDVSSNVFKGLKVQFYRQNGLYKYVTGKFRDISEAYEFLENVELLGFEDAFIVAFNKDKRIDIKEAIRLSQ